jgi:hypothetical protein
MCPLHHLQHDDQQSSPRPGIHLECTQSNAGDFYNTTLEAQEISSASGLPYAFFSRPVVGWRTGFPVVFQVCKFSFMLKRQREADFLATA